MVNSSNTILDDIWAWRADHGSGVGWTDNVADHGLIVNGNNVTAYGLFVEHYQKTQVIWNGQNGKDIFFQNEMPYDPPSQAAWMANATTDGYPAFEVTGGWPASPATGWPATASSTRGCPSRHRAFKVPGTPGRPAARHPDPFPQRIGRHQLRGQRHGRAGNRRNPGPSDVVSYP